MTITARSNFDGMLAGLLGDPNEAQRGFKGMTCNEEP
jgi:hypothetical protein